MDLAWQADTAPCLLVHADVLRQLASVEPALPTGAEAADDGCSDMGAPDSRWFLLGGRGSGSEVHQDPPCKPRPRPSQHYMPHIHT